MPVSDIVLMDVSEEIDDPFPDLHALFVYYNELYFENKLGACSVEWSSQRMTTYRPSHATVVDVTCPSSTAVVRERASTEVVDARYESQSLCTRSVLDSVHLKNVQPTNSLRSFYQLQI